VAEFGRPAELAARLAGDERLIPAWMRSLGAGRLATMVLVMLGAVLLVAVVAGERPVVITVGQVCWALLFATMIVTLLRLAINRLDGRSVASAITWPVLVVWLAGSALLATLAGIDRVLLEVPTWVAIIVAVTLVVPGLALARAMDSPIRFPPGAEHLAPLKRGVLAGRAPAG
jgi:cobalamin synthase